MKLTTENQNYCATVVQVDKLIPLEGCDNLLAFPIFGYQAIVSKDTKVGDLGIVFTAETQLSEQYCKENNLFRNSEYNKDPDKKGYMENNRRVKAMKFRGHKSSALFMPLGSLGFLPRLHRSEFLLGDTFDTIDGIKICEKYVVWTPEARGNKVRGKTKTFIRVDNKVFPEHFDTENYFRNKFMYRDNDVVTVTQKLHGTSGRFGHIIVRRKLSFWENILKKFGVRINDTEYDYMAGSRRVVKDTKTGENKVGYYATDIWNKTLDSYKTKPRTIYSMVK